MNLKFIIRIGAIVAIILLSVTLEEKENTFRLVSGQEASAVQAGIPFMDEYSTMCVIPTLVNGQLVNLPGSEISCVWAWATCKNYTSFCLVSDAPL